MLTQWRCQAITWAQAIHWVGKSTAPIRRRRLEGQGSQPQTVVQCIRTRRKIARASEHAPSSLHVEGNWRSFVTAYCMEVPLALSMKMFRRGGRCSAPSLQTMF